jgi:hypothetical protein
MISSWVGLFSPRIFSAGQKRVPTTNLYILYEESVRKRKGMLIRRHPLFFMAPLPVCSLVFQGLMYSGRV